MDSRTAARATVAGLSLALLSGGALAGCGDGSQGRHVVDEYEIDAGGSYSIAAERPFARPLTSDDFGSGFPATYRQEDGGDLVMHGDGTGYLDQFLIAECGDSDNRWHAVTGPVRFAEEGIFDLWLYSTDGALVFNIFVMVPMDFAPTEISFSSCSPTNEDSAQLVIED